MAIFKAGPRFFVAALCLLLCAGTHADDASVKEVLFQNARIFDGTSAQLSPPTRLLVRGNLIAAIGDDVMASPEARVIDARGHTLMPGLIDVHVHLTFGALTMLELLSPELTPESAEAAASREAEAMLLRGFTAVRDVGGPVWGLKAGIDAGRYVGPRVWP